MSTNNPDEIRREIEDTRGRLSDDVNALTETVSPSNVARRQVDKVTGVASSVKDRVMGTADDLRSTGSDAASSVGDAASSVGHAPAAAADKARVKTQGNPLAAGLVALGVGWLVGSMLPASEKEKQAASTLQDKAQPLVDEAKSVAQETAQELKEPAMQAAQSIKETATEAKDNVVQEGQSTAQDVKSQAQDSAESVRASQ